MSQPAASVAPATAPRDGLHDFDFGAGTWHTHILRNVLVRAVWSNITANAHRYEEFFSDNGGKTWRLSFTANKTRIPASAP